MRAIPNNLLLQEPPHLGVLDEDDEGGVADLATGLCQLAKLKNLQRLQSE